VLQVDSDYLHLAPTSFHRGRHHEGEESAMTRWKGSVDAVEKISFESGVTAAPALTDSVLSKN
jgi:hypothetical protein